MKAFAPGKLVLTGAYAVLEGAPCIVVATSRGVVADTARRASFTTPEVEAALGSVAAPDVDASALFLDSRKLGLGASAAILVASLAAREAEAGRDVGDDDVRAALFSRAREAHATAQSGGSGVDVAASVFGGALRYTMGALPVRVTLPRGAHLSVFACGNSARTSDLRGKVDALAASSPALHRECMDALQSLARDAAQAVDAGALERLVDVVRRTSAALARLGDAAGAPIVPTELRELSDIAARESAAFCVSGAGGGDVAVYLGSAPPSAAFLTRASALGLLRLDLGLDEKGVRALPTPAVFATADV
ncbi:Phosphomevalonate kinase [Labilithrix luteola]|uniref:phosphomevalonate kinase n=1 Tax=Labilithrix luteola TaxID=1391654 RepID=A0A0K1Q7C6_9BACT|nr:hypothetical protein [Labilithrix luteola]AKV01634.1 Phosphomevalonate kinase [Labilithrix luteola]